MFIYLISGISTKDITRNHSNCSGAQVSALSVSSPFSSRAATSAADGTVWYLEAIAHTERVLLISKVNRGKNKIQAQLWVISVSLLATLSLWQGIYIWFPDIKVPRVPQVSVVLIVRFYTLGIFQSCLLQGFTVNHFLYFFYPYS